MRRLLYRIDIVIDRNLCSSPMSHRTRFLLRDFLLICNVWLSFRFQVFLRSNKHRISSERSMCLLVEILYGFTQTSKYSFDDWHSKTTRSSLFPIKTIYWMPIRTIFKVNKFLLFQLWHVSSLFCILLRYHQWSSTDSINWIHIFCEWWYAKFIHAISLCKTSVFRSFHYTFVSRTT